MRRYSCAFSINQPPSTIHPFTVPSTLNP